MNTMLKLFIWNVLEIVSSLIGSKGTRNRHSHSNFLQLSNLCSITLSFSRDVQQLQHLFRSNIYLTCLTSGTGIAARRVTPVDSPLFVAPVCPEAFNVLFGEGTLLNVPEFCSCNKPQYCNNCVRNYGSRICILLTYAPDEAIGRVV